MELHEGQREAESGKNRTFVTAFRKPQLPGGLPVSVPQTEKCEYSVKLCPSMKGLHASEIYRCH